MTILQDTREQKPFVFKGAEVIRQTLRVGDYTILGLKKTVAVERKAKEDFYFTFGVQYRYNIFCKEMKQINEMAYGYLVVEGSIEQCINMGSGEGQSEWQLEKSQFIRDKNLGYLGKNVESNFNHFLENFPNVKVKFCNNRKHAQKYTHGLLDWIAEREGVD